MRIPALVLALIAVATLALGRPTGSTTGVPFGASADSILATARALSGETGIGERSRFAPRPETELYVAYLRDRLTRALAPLGGEVRTLDYDPGFETVGGDSIRSPYQNIVGIVPGVLDDPEAGFFLLGAHLDATAQRESLFAENWRTFDAPGADDNGSGLSVLLEVARIMAERGMRPDADLVFAFFDGEEQQIPEKDKFLTGARAMATTQIADLEDDLGRLYGFINLDMVAYNPRRDSLVVLTNTSSRWLANRVVEVHLADPSPEFSVDRVVQGLNFSDHGPFWEEGYPAVLFIENPSIEDHAPHYHKVTDTVDNVYLRGGSQARKTAELVLSIIDTWINDGGASDLAIDPDALLISSGLRSDVELIEAGRESRITVGVINRGDTRTDPWSVSAEIEIDGRVVKTLEREHGETPFPAGAFEKLTFAWTPRADEAGSPRIRVRLSDPGDMTEGDEATRFVAVEGTGGAILRAFVYPNPTRWPAGAALRYELARKGPVRLILLDIRGRELAQTDLRFDPVFPGPGVSVGAADLSLSEVFPSLDLAPGLYLLRVELFDEMGQSATDVEVVRWAVLR